MENMQDRIQEQTVFDYTADSLKNYFNEEKKGVLRIVGTGENRHVHYIRPKDATFLDQVWNWLGVFGYGIKKTQNFLEERHPFFLPSVQAGQDQNLYNKKVDQLNVFEKSITDLFQATKETPPPILRASVTVAKEIMLKTIKKQSKVMKNKL